MPRSGRPPIAVTLAPPDVGGMGYGVVKEGERRVNLQCMTKLSHFNRLLPNVVKSPPIIEFLLRCDWSPDSI